MFRVGKDLLGLSHLDQFTHIEKCGLITDTPCLLHVVRNDHNGILFFNS